MRASALAREFHSAGNFGCVANTTVTDSYGRVVTFGYEDRGVIESVTAPDGEVYRFEYAEPYIGSTRTTGYSKNWFTVLTNVVLPDDTTSTTDNPRVTYFYENALSPTLLTGIEDERGVRIRTWDYDSQARATLSSRYGGVDDYSLSFGSSATTVTNPLGRVETWSTPANSQGLLRLTQIAGASTANVAASTASAAYDTNGYLSQITDAESRVTTFVRNARGLETNRTEGAGTSNARTINTSWHSSYAVPTQVAEPGLTTNATYNSAGNITKLSLVDTTSHSSPYSTNGQTREWNYTYTAAGQLETADGPLSGAGDVVEYDYDTEGNLASVTNEIGQTTFITSVDGAGRPLTVLDVNGVATALTYTPRGWVDSITVNPGAEQRQTSFDYDVAGRVVEVTLPTGGTLSYTYDNAEHLTEVENDFGDVMSLTYNEMGQVTGREFSTSSATLRYAMSRTYDEIGRVLSTIGAASETETRAYDRTNLQTTITDPRGEVWTTAYDSISRAISDTNPESQSVQYAYDGRDNLTTQTDGRSLQTVFVRNGFDDIIRETSPERGATVYVYDAAGRVVEMTDADGVEVNFTYDDAGRLTSKTFPGSSSLDQTFTYDDTTNGNFGEGRVTSAEDAHGVRTFVYNEFGEATRETRTIGSHSYQTDYAYSGGGAVTLITYPTGRQVRYVRDAQDRVTAVDTRVNSGASWASVADNVTWRPFGPLESLDYGNGLGLDLGYDQNYWLTDIDVAGSGTTTLDLSFTRDDAGAMTVATDAVNSSRSATFDYTASGRLEEATGLWGTLEWTYDAAGNRTQETRTSGSTSVSNYSYPSTSNRLSEIRDGSSTLLRDFTYRQNGQVYEDDRAGVGVYNYDYDANGRMY